MIQRSGSTKLSISLSIKSPAAYRLPSVVRSRVTAAPGSQAWTLERVTWLTPYTADTIAQEARRAGPGARLEVTVPRNTSAEGVATVERLFGWLRAKGIALTVQRGNE